MDSLSVNGATTVVGREHTDSFDDATLGGKGKGRMPSPPIVGAIPTSKRLFRHVNHLAQNSNRPFFVPITTENGGILGALDKLDEQIRASGRAGIMSKKEPFDWVGREVNPGEIGLINHGGLPSLVTKPGRYPGYPFSNMWAREWCGTKGLSDTVIEFQGLTCVQVSQNQAAVISDPQNQVFVVQNGGFVAYAVDGSYETLAVVDQVHLPTIVKDPTTKATLGSMLEVQMNSRLNGQNQNFVVATFLNIPANNCAILQRGDDLELLPAGQFYLTDPNITVRGMYTTGECQYEMPTKDIFTRDQVPVSLTIYLKWQLTEPLKLATHGYTTPYEALRDKAQSILTQIMAHLDYSSLVKQRGISPNDTMDDGTEPETAFLDALRSRAMDDLYLAAQEYGIILKDLAVIERMFKGEIASTMDRLTQRALQAQVEAANVDRENSNKVKTEEGALQVARIKAQVANAKADADAYAVIAAARAAAEATRIAAQAQADSLKLVAAAESDATRTKAEADSSVTDNFAREMELRRIDVLRVSAFGNKTVFTTTDMAPRQSDALAVGMAASMGRSGA